jgi:hypothetical protein
VNFYIKKPVLYFSLRYFEENIPEHLFSYGTSEQKEIKDKIRNGWLEA